MHRAWEESKKASEQLAWNTTLQQSLFIFLKNQCFQVLNVNIELLNCALETKIAPYVNIGISIKAEKTKKYKQT